jgi:hypothetical protein
MRSLSAAALLLSSVLSLVMAPTTSPTDQPILDRLGIVSLADASEGGDMDVDAVAIPQTSSLPPSDLAHP